LSWDGFLNETLRGFGVSPARLDVLWRTPSVPSDINPAAKCLIHLTQDLYKQHLLPGPKFNILTDKFKASLNLLTKWDRISTHYGLRGALEARNMSLYDICADIMIDATQMTLFDDILFQIDPKMTRKIRTFSDELWKLMYPSRLLDAREVTAVREQYIRAFLIYQRLPKELRKGEAWIVSTLIDQYKALGIHEDDSAAMLVMIYWT
jgi:cholesterol 7alpha-monooxygenase